MKQVALVAGFDKETAHEFGLVLQTTPGRVCKSPCHEHQASVKRSSAGATQSASSRLKKGVVEKVIQSHMEPSFVWQRARADADLAPSCTHQHLSSRGCAHNARAFPIV
jgi:hypothetical protein